MKTLLTLAAAMTLGFSGAAADSASTWLSLPAGSSFDLAEHPSGSLPRDIPAHAPSARISIVLQGGAPEPANLQAKLREVVFRDGREVGLALEFKAQWDPGEEAKRGPSLVVWFEGASLAAGAYTLTCDLVCPAPGTNANWARPQPPLTLVLRKPAAELAPSPPVVLKQVWWLGWPCAAPGRFKLEKTSGSSGLTGVRYNQTHDSSPGTGKLVLTQTSANSAESPGYEASVAVQGGFPLGKNTGKIQLRANELEKPVEIAYEVHSRRTPLWILLLVLGGFGAGYFVRVVLRNREALATACAAACDTLQALQEAKAGVGDSDFHRQMDKSREALAQAIRDGQAQAGKASTVAAADKAVKAIGDAASLAQSELKAAQQDLADRINKLRSDVQPWHDYLHQTWQLPPAAHPLYQSALTTVDAISELIDEQNAGGQSAGRLWDKLKSQATALAQALRQWQCDLADFFDDLKDAPPPLANPSKVLDAATAWKSQTGLEVSSDPIGDAPSLAAALRAANLGYDSARWIAQHATESANKLLAWLHASTEKPMDSLPNQRPALERSLQALEEASRQAVNSVGVAVDDPVRAGADLARLHDATVAAWKDFLVRLVPPAGDDQPIKDSLANNQWLEAAQAAVGAAQQALPQAPQPQPAAQPAGGPQLAFLMAAPPAILPPFKPAPVTHDGTRFPARMGQALLTNIERRKDYFLRQAELSSKLQTAILAALATAVACALYATAWVGTLYEMLGIFVWAFGMDISSNAVVGAAKNLKLPSA